MVNCNVSLFRGVVLGVFLVFNLLAEEYIEDLT